MELYHKKSKSKSKSKTRKMKKYRNKQTKHKKGISYKKNKIRIKMIKMKGGGSPIKERDEFFLTTYNYIRTYNIKGETHDDIQQLNDKYSKLLLDNIYNKPDNMAFTNNYLAKLIINMFLPKIIQSIDRRDNNAVTEIETFQRYVDFEPELGSVLKVYGLTNLTIDPSNSLLLLNSCVDDIKYCPMDSSRFICDYLNKVEYLCGKEDGDSIYRINDNEDFKKIINGRYLYCLLPDRTLCLFPKGNHSAGACGQPVICAGFVDIVNNKIIGIDNNSGHYSPNQAMLGEAIRILTQKGILSMKKNQSINDNITKIIFTDGTERRGPACDTQPLSEPPDIEDPDVMNEGSNSSDSERNSELNSNRKRMRS